MLSCCACKLPGPPSTSISCDQRYSTWASAEMMDLIRLMRESDSSVSDSMMGSAFNCDVWSSCADASGAAQTNNASEMMEVLVVFIDRTYLKHANAYPA